MTVHRGRVTAVDTKGVYVRVAALGPDVLGPLEWLGSKPEVDDGVLVLNAGTESAPDLVVMLVGNVTIPEGVPLTVGGLTVWDTGAGFIRLDAFGSNVRLYAGLTQLNIAYGTASTGYIATNRETVASHPSGALTSKGYVDQIKTDIKAIAAASSSFADFQTRIAAW